MEKSMEKYFCNQTVKTVMNINKIAKDNNLPIKISIVFDESHRDFEDLDLPILRDRYRKEEDIFQILPESLRSLL